MNRYYRVKQRVRFPEFFPAIRDLIVDNSHIYLLTWRKKEQEHEFFIFDLEGKLVKKTFVPLQDYDDGVALFPYSLKNNYFYQLIDNEEEEVWELQRFSIL